MLRKLLIVFLVIVGVSLLLYPKLEAFYFAGEQENLVKEFELLSSIDVDENQDNTMDVSNNGLQGIGDTSVVGILRLEAIDLELAIFEGATNENLDRGLGSITSFDDLGTSNVSIAGHRSVTDGKLFNRLGEVDEGDTIDVISRYGQYVFVVEDVFVVHETDVSVLEDAGEAVVTLVTCTPIGAKDPEDRLIIRGSLIENFGV